jgi:hypothetical protein
MRICEIYKSLYIVLMLIRTNYLFYTVHMTFAALFSFASPTHALRVALMTSLHHAHRPELADVVRSADLAVHETGLWVRPVDASLQPRLVGSEAFRSGGRTRTPA